VSTVDEKALLDDFFRSQDRMLLDFLERYPDLSFADVKTLAASWLGYFERHWRPLGPVVGPQREIVLRPMKKISGGD
jgi:hypothetical protein